MDIRIIPHSLCGKVQAIPSKSAAHRLLICAALADQPTFLRLSFLCEDVLTTIRCLEALGAGIEQKSEGLLVTPLNKDKIDTESCPMLDCGESGSTLRFLLPVACSLSHHVRFAGKGRLPQRPIEELLLALESGGVRFSAHALPFEATGCLCGSTFSLPGNISSQYISGLLMALPLLGGGRLHLTTPVESRTYVEMTADVLRQFGIAVEEAPDGYMIQGENTYHSPHEVTVTNDWSNAAFFLAAGALGSAVSVGGLIPDSLQADSSILSHLSHFGADCKWKDGALSVMSGSLHGAELDLSQCPDLLPVLAVVASQTQGMTRFYHCERLRYKESDRIASTASMLMALGCRVDVAENELKVYCSRLTGGVVDGAHDHRIIMASAIAALVCTEPVTITGCDAVEKSYPAFFSDYQSLGGMIHVL